MALERLASFKSGRDYTAIPVFRNYDTALESVQDFSCSVFDACVALISRPEFRMGRTACGR